jgi:radical SAM-linked protein
MRCIQRAVRRACIPISYSGGFNPHAELSFATPLPVGTSSTGEYLEIKLDCIMDPGMIMSRMNETLPNGISVTAVVGVRDTFPSLMSVIGAAAYEIAISNAGNIIVDDVAERFLGRDTIEVVKKGKNGVREIDIKPMIYRLTLDFMGSEAVIHALIAAGSRSNLNPDLLMQGLKLYIDELREIEITDIMKKETFVLDGGCFKTPLELI